MDTVGRHGQCIVRRTRHRCQHNFPRAGASRSEGIDGVERNAGLGHILHCDDVAIAGCRGRSDKTTRALDRRNDIIGSLDECASHRDAEFWHLECVDIVGRHRLLRPITHDSRVADGLQECEVITHLGHGMDCHCGSSSRVVVVDGNGTVLGIDDTDALVAQAERCIYRHAVVRHEERVVGIETDLLTSRLGRDIDTLGDVAMTRRDVHRHGIADVKSRHVGYTGSMTARQRHRALRTRLAGSGIETCHIFYRRERRIEGHMALGVRRHGIAVAVLEAVDNGRQARQSFAVLRHRRERVARIGHGKDGDVLADASLVGGAQQRTAHNSRVVDGHIIARGDERGDGRDGAVAHIEVRGVGAGHVGSHGKCGISAGVEHCHGIDAESILACHFVCQDTAERTRQRVEFITLLRRDDEVDALIGVRFHAFVERHKRASNHVTHQDSAMASGIGTCAIGRTVELRCYIAVLRRHDEVIVVVAERDEVDVMLRTYGARADIHQFYLEARPWLNQHSHRIAHIGEGVGSEILTCSAVIEQYSTLTVLLLVNLDTFYAEIFGREGRHERQVAVVDSAESFGVVVERIRVASAAKAGQSFGRYGVSIYRTEERASAHQMLERVAGIGRHAYRHGVAAHHEFIVGGARTAVTVLGTNHVRLLDERRGYRNRTVEHRETRNGVYMRRVAAQVQQQGIVVLGHERRGPVECGLHIL